ncbi:MAG: UDP-N-acetylmuramoyl-L-alanyl-D-glutamate--2,6-diaminopimelate ligase, partial [Candidatus Zophobacter franzmannii]|nr:UDP-N-acetylmuramoyl-L-alanyl-D-glutamate--2,6-diaminopimelate ligase [Candidatus Zophobacter franzmannii]
MQNKTQIRQIIDVLKFNGIFQSKNLIAGIETINGTVRTDSRKIVEGDIFVAIKGFVTDGHYFVRQAVSQGASLIISEDFISCEISQIKVTDSRKATAIIINEITGKPTSKLKLIGITGTNGKTTSAFIAGNIFRQLNIKYGIIGTLGYYIEDEFYPSKLTTPDILDLNKIFLKMLKVGVEVVVMEVSAHAISLRRISGLEFDVACFTNLSRDHLDFYEDMDHYFDAKRMFIETTSARKGKVVINVEDEWGSKLYQLVKGRKYSIGSKNCDYVISAEQMLSDRSSFTMKYASETITFDVNLSARYNIRNAAMALIAVHLAYPDINITKVSLNNLDFVPGRLERIITSNGSTVFIDYAHTPEAVKKVLENIREFAKGRIITVCGAGGDRDRGKRPEMLTQALDNSDYVIITNDNPRYENPSSIIDEIVGGTDIEENFWIIRDRKLAIETAIKLAHKEDIVLIAGKGHEEYQEISGVRHPFSDKEVAINSHEKTELSNMLSVYIDLLMLTKVLKVDFKNDEDSVFKYVSTDSRSIKSHTVFFALKGGRFDGHNYLDNVLNDPTNWAVVSRRINHPRCIYVADTLKAYQDVAKKYLNLFNVHKIAITGSAGKTTTKEFLSNILSAKFKTHKTYANENNLIGLPKTIFKLTSAH